MIFANFYLFDHPLCIVRARRLFLQAVEDQVVPEERENKSKSFINHPADQMIWKSTKIQKRPVALWDPKGTKTVSLHIMDNDFFMTLTHDLLGCFTFSQKIYLVFKFCEAIFTYY